MEKKLRIALAQINPTVGDLKGNRKKIKYFLKQAQQYKVDVVIFPELAICGYPPEDLLLKGHFVRDNLETLNSLIEETSGIVMIVGFVDSDEKGNLYNSAAIVQNGQLKGIYHKFELPNYGVFDEKRYFQPGERVPLFKLGGTIFGVTICEDIWKRDGVVKLEADRGAQLIINISASPYHAGKRELRKQILTERVRETKTHICYTNQIGGQDELVFDGGSAIIDPDGEIIAKGMEFEEDLVMGDLRIRESLKEDTKTNDKNYIALDEVETAEKPPLPKRKYITLTRLEEIYSALVLGTRDYIIKNGFKKVVIGLSGGIDSSLTAVIACDAIGKENVIGVSMPSQYSSQQTQSDTKALANNLGIRLIVVPIASIFKAYLMSLEKEFKGLKRDVTEENLQARIRGNILMAFSNKFGWLVLTTGNKSETSVGYCTLYGDMAGGFAVIKDVPKMLVYELACYRNKKESKNVIPESILNREPSAELKPDQKDSDSLPPYPVLDEILKRYVEEDRSLEEIVLSTKFDSEVVKDVIRKVDRNEYKRRQSPPGVKITPKAFGKDRRLPIVNRYREDQEQV